MGLVEAGVEHRDQRFVVECTFNDRDDEALAPIGTLLGLLGQI
ncbi:MULTISPECIES: hypothetical protein [Bradyrhizobium]|nr:hypothetical protein [Bradyrhizobium japonicum]